MVDMADTPPLSEFRYTAFPTLGDAAYPRPTTLKSKGVFEIPENVQKEALIISWAALLRGYSGSDKVAFKVNDGVFYVDFENDTLREVVAPPDLLGVESTTAVYFTKQESIGTSQLCLRVDLESSTASLTACAAIVPPTHLANIIDQLSHLVACAPASPRSAAIARAVELNTYPRRNGNLDAPRESTRNLPVLSVLNPEPVKLAGPELLHDLVGPGDSCYRGATAIEFLNADGQLVMLSYEELHALSDKLSSTIRNILARSSRRKTVAILLPQCSSLYVILLSILKAGAAFVPLNLDAPDERIRFVVDDVDAGAIVTNSSFRDKFGWPEAPEVLVVDDHDIIDQTSGGLAERGIHSPLYTLPSNAAYIMYTSGSTGKPKGVTISHSAATQSLLAHDRHIPRFRRFLQFAAPTFDVSVFEIFFCFFRGSTLVGCDRGRLLADLPGVISELEVDAAELTPTVAGEILGERDALPGLKVLLTIGEMLTRRVVDQFGNGLLHGMYGPTEAAIHCTLATDFRKEAKVGNVGVPLDTVSAFIVAPQTDLGGMTDVEVLPLGWVGELAVGGWQLADGYINRPDLTKEAFVDSSRWGRLYRTGDRARILPSGSIECLGRVSAGQVKIRGQRAELGEIEEVVLKTQGVKAAVASVINGNLVVHISTAGRTSKDAVRAVCRRWLPGFMVPSDVVIFEDLPRLPSGKANRKRLEEDYSKQVREAAQQHENMDDAEQVVARNIEELLRLRPRRDESLVSLGLDSIQAIKLVSLLRSEGLRVEVLDVVKSDTVAGIASTVNLRPDVSSTVTEEVRAYLSTVRASGLSRISLELHHDVEAVIPCTSLQEALIAETVRDPRVYCNWILLDLPSTVDAVQVEAAFRAIVQRSEILRTGFIPIGNGFAQVIWKTSRSWQFSRVKSVEPNWKLSLKDMLEPPFMGEHLENENGAKKLSVRIHHALYDGWSWEHIVSDFQSLLARDDLLPQRPQFRDFVRWELGVSPESTESTRAFWQSTLKDAGEIRLPNFHGRHDVKSGVIVEGRRLSTSRSTFEGCARSTGVSPQVLAQSAWAYLLSSYVGKRDIVFGTVVSGRAISLDHVEDIIGPMIRTLPVRVQVRLDRNVSDLLLDVHAFNMKLLEHAELGLREIKKACGDDCSFDSLLVWQQTTNDRRDGTVKVSDSQDNLEFSLLVEVEPRDTDIDIRVTYKREMFPTAQISLLLQQMDFLISSFVENTDQSLGGLVSGLEQHAEILSIENPHPAMVPPSSTRTLATVFEDTASRHPNAVALEMTLDIRRGAATMEKLTYTELNASANKLARELVHRGTRPDEMVAICMDKSIFCYVSILATVKAGAGYLPLTVETPIERAKTILKNAQVRILLSTRDFMDQLGSVDDVDIIDVKTLDLSSQKSDDLGLIVSSRTLAYAVFTSGSTGVPKGVLVEHYQAVGNLDAVADLYPTAVGKRMLQFCNIAFDVSVFEIFFTWHRGMVLCSATKDVLLHDIEAAVNALKITHLSMTPTVAALISPQNVPGVEFLVTSGEAVTKKVFNDWAGRGGFYQGYGPSETTNICTANKNVEKAHDISNIGPPFENTSAFVVAADEEELILLPRGGVGELCFGGVQVARGYLNMDGLTARKFVVHPKYGKIYRSGDIGRLLPSGDIIFVGRQDDQVKIRGNRIEPGEVTSVLLRNPGIVIDAVTLVVTKGEQSQLVSYVVLASYQTSSFAVVQHIAHRNLITDLFEQAAAFVPLYMVPSAIVPVTMIPMTHQGKADKKALNAAFLNLDNTSLGMFSKGETLEEDSGNWTDIECFVAKSVAEVAHVHPNTIGRNTSIFKLGLDSISAIYLSRKLEGANKERLEVSQIMRNPTVAALAIMLAELTKPKVDSARQTGAARLREFADSVLATVLEQLEYVEEDIVKILPCTPLQEAMLSMKRDSPRNCYNHTVLKLKADPERLKSAWESVAKAHDIMRTCFVVTSHRQHAYAQVVVREHPLPWTQHEPDSTKFSDTVEEHISQVSNMIDTSRPPYAFGLFKSPEHTCLVMSFHHSLYDGFALNLLLEEVQRAYSSPSDLLPRMPFDIYLAYMGGIHLGAADEFWLQKFRGFQPTSFPGLTGRSNAVRKQLTGMTSRSLTCSKGLDAINAGCKSLSISLLALGQSSWARLLSVYTGEHDLCFGNVISGRTIPVDGVEEIIAPCFNTLPVRITLNSGVSTRSVMEKLRDSNTEMMPYQLTPLRRIMTVLKTNGRTLFDTLFILQHAPENNFHELWEEVDDRGEMDFSIVIELVPNRVKGTLEIVIRFRRDTVLEEHIEVLLQQFDATVVSALETPDAPAFVFDFLSSDLLSEANRKPTVLVSECKDLLHAEFENNAQKSPERVALEYLEDDGSITTFTFGEINSQANKIANHLLSLGIGREEPIPLCIGKSPRFYISVLGVLKAGGAFTPIDPTLPPSRKNFMIKELQTKIVLVGSSGAADIEQRDLKFIDVCKILQQDGDASDPELSNLSERNLAYRLYTSGSTGLPKAVSIEHRSAVQTLRASRSIIRWVRSSKLLQFAATTFDMCYYDIFMAWSYGFTLCSAATKYLLGELAPTIKRMGVTMLDLTPTVAATLRAYELPEVKLLYCIGETMPQKLASDWDGRCVNSYGPTETAMCCTITDVSGDIKAANIGKPFETTKFVILDRDGKYVMPLFSSGELCIGGQQVAREYHNNPQLTKSRFISFDGDILYRTGDMARQLADGTFEFIGRADDQVKIRGLRVELDEINMVLRDSSEDIQDASTIVLRHISASAKEQLVSFIALGGRKQHGSVAKVQNHCGELISVVRKSAQKMLPRYMVPGVIIVVDHIPLSAAGKVDKKTLGALFQDQDIGLFSRGLAETEDEEWTEIERKMRDIFSQISQVPAVQIYKSSTIYEVGLDSISAAQVASRLKQLGIQISVIDILERPSIEQISTFLEEISETPGSAKDSHFVQDFQSEFFTNILAERRLDTTSVAGVYPCTAAQEGMLSQFLRSQGKLYFNHTLLKLPMGTDDDALRAAWGTVFDSTDILRAGFVEMDDAVHSFATLIYQPGHIQLPWSTVKEIDDLQNFVRMERKYAANRALRNIHLPLWKLVFIRTKSGECYLFFSGHHALYDATSLQLIFQDVRAVHEGSKIPCRPQFSGVLEGIIQHTLDLQLVENDKIFWLKQLEHSSITRMPNLCAVRVSSTGSYVKELTSTWALSRIESACQERAVSLHAAGQAAWARVLSAYTGETALTLGVVFTGRVGLKNAEEVAFPCVVTLPSTSVVTGTNQQLVYDIQTSNARAFKHQHTPLRSIQRWFDHPEESFFDSVFVYQKIAGKRMPWEPVDEYASVDYTISLEIEPTAGDCLLIRATARNNHIPPEQTDMIIRQFEAALKDILENPHNPANDFSLIPSELLSITPASVDKIPTEVKLLHEFVQKHRHLCPDKIAFEFATAIEGDGVVTKQTWTYRQLDNEGNKFANFLRQKGAKTGDIVGISFEKCPEASFAILGILKAGCAYVALDYSAPIGRKVFIVEDSMAKIVLTMDKYVSEIQGAVGVEVISAKSEAITTASEEAPVVQDLTPDSLCYCLYTSGTTGTPKGCEITHENAVQAMMAFQRLFSPHWDADSKFLQFASFHFDVSVLEQYWSWSVGVCVTSAPRDLIFQDLPGTIDSLKITHLDLTPSLGALLRPEDVPNLCRGVFITGGEALKQEILDTWGRVGCIYNGYGPTEVTIGMTMYPRVPANGKPSNIGPQFDNVGTYVFAPGTERPVLRGALGELCAAGKLVGRGYLNRPRLTKERFPFLEKYGEKIYRTGDLVRILHNSTFDFAGRTDDQVKLRGQRLEIGEINEVVKKANQSVGAVATLVLGHPKQQKDQLVSFVVLNAEHPGAQSKPEVRYDGNHSSIIPKLIAACKSRLPGYMVPTHFLPLSHIPLSVNNKVDNKTLKAVYHETTLEMLQLLTKQEEDDGQWNDVEKRVRSILVDMTKLEEIDIKRLSTVFELGLDSVSVVGLARRLKKSGFGIATPSLIMQHPTLAQLAAELTEGVADGAADIEAVEATGQLIAAFANQSLPTVCDRLQLDTDNIERILPCTSLQEGMIARFLDSDRPLYFNSFPMTLGASTDVENLKKAWGNVVQSTEILKTCFCETADGYAQIVLQDAPLRWDEVEINKEDFGSEVERGLLRSVSGNRYLRSPPISILGIKTPTKYVLVLYIFHALYDGNSLPLILSDVQTAYDGSYRPRQSQFGDVMGHLLSTDLKEGQKFWVENVQLGKPLPLEQLRGASGEQVFGDYGVGLKLEFSMGDLEILCQKIQCTPQPIFQAAWASVLAAYVGPVVTFGLIVSGRSLPLDDIEEVIGPTFNTIPCTFAVEESSSWETLIKAIHKFNSESIPFHHTPLRRIRKWLHKNTELFDTLFVYQKHCSSEMEDQTLWQLSSGTTTTDYPLSLEIAQSASGELDLTIVAKADIAREKTSEILHEVANRIRDILSNPQGSPLPEPEPPHSEKVQVDSIVISSIGHPDDFIWNEQALVLRKNIAELAEVSENEVSADSTILELGLDSIEAIKLSTRLRQYDIALSASTIMKNTTIRKMQQTLEAPAQIQLAKKLDLLARYERTVRQRIPNLQDTVAICPTTPLQEAMVAETLASDYTHYFNHNVLKLEEWVDLDQLRAAWISVVESNDILRTSFAAVEDENGRPRYCQLVHSNSGGRWKLVEVADEVTAQATCDAVMNSVTESADVLSEPPVYLTIVKAPKSTHLILSISHALYDGWSLGLLHNDIKRAYFDALTPRPSPRVMIERIFNTDIETSRRYWKQLLHGMAASRFPGSVFTSLEPVRTHRAEKTSALPFTVVQGYCKKAGVTVQTLGQCCWALVLAHYLGETDVVFGNVLSGRDFEQAEDIMFPAMNTVPVRAILHGTYREMLSYMQLNGSSTLMHQHTPLREIQRLMNMGGTRLFDTLFLYQRDGPLGSGNQVLYRSVGGTSDNEYNVAVEMERNADSIVWRNACKSSAFDLIGTHHMLDLLDSLLSHVVQNPDHPTFADKQGHLAVGNTRAVRLRQKQTLNGVRTDLADIATAIKQLSRNIDDCAAVVTTENGHDVLVVFVTGQQAEGAIPELLDRAKKTLPQWLIPSHIASCKAIPYKNSEVDIRALQTMLAASPDEPHQLSKSRGDWSSLEQQIRRVLSQVSGQPEAEIYRDQTIFHLGLDSISAIKLSSDLKREGIMLTVADILRGATVERMANAAYSKHDNSIAKLEIDADAVLKKALARLDIFTCLAGFSGTQVEAVYPATAGQLYMIEAWNSSHRTLFMPTFTFKTNQTDLARIQSAWETLLSQEPLLRTAFRQTGDAVIPYIQVVLRRSSPQFSWYQSSQPSDNSFLHFLKNQEQKKPVDLFLPPVRLCANITPYGSTLFLTIHHVLYDGTSLPLLLSRLGKLLSGPTSSPSRSSSPRFSGYLAFTHTQDLRKQKSFWQDYLHNARSTLVPTRASPPQQSSRSEAYRPRAQARTDLLESKCRTAGISLQAVFLAAFAKLYLTRLPVSTAVANEVVFGIYLSNRNLPVPDLPNMAAPTLNIVPLRVRGASTTNLVNLAKEVQEDLIAISNPENAVVDLHKIAKWTGVEVNCFFNFLKSSSGGEDATGHGLEEIEVDATGDVVQTNNDEERVGRRYRSLFSQLFSRVFGLGTLVRIVCFWQWILRIIDHRKAKAAQLASTKTAIELTSSAVTIRTNLDIEVAVRGNSVDVGVFSRTEFFEREELGEIIEELCETVAGI